LEEGDDIMGDLAKDDILFTVRPVADPLKPHEGFHLEEQPDTMKYVSPEDMKDKGMQTDRKSWLKKKKEPKPDVRVVPRKAASNIEIFTPKNNTVNPFKPMEFASETAMQRKRLHRNHYDDKDKAVQAPEEVSSQEKVRNKSLIKPTIPTAVKETRDDIKQERTGKPLTSTKPMMDTTTKSQRNNNDNNDKEVEECEVCPGFNPTINWGELTWLQLFQYMQADGGWYSCRGRTNTNNTAPNDDRNRRASSSRQSESERGTREAPLRELYKSKASIQEEGGGGIQEAALSKAHHHPHHHKKSKSKSKGKSKDKSKDKSDKDES